MKLLKFVFFAATLSLLLFVLTSCGGCDHDFKDTVIEATCTEGGKTIRTCQKCGEIQETDIVPAKGHDYTVTTYEPDCDSVGYTESVCFCGHSYRSDMVVPKGHSLNEVVTLPACEALGYTTHTCTVCSYSFRDSYAEPLGHRFERLTTPPTCAEQGYTVYRCSCGYTYTADYLPAKGHDLQKTVSDPTCTEEGYDTYHCACGYNFSTNHKSPHGHEFEETVNEPTCTESGVTLYSCKCGYIDTAITSAPLGHRFEKVITPPTCTDEGFTTYTCVCGLSFDSNLVAPKGHSFEEIITMPTVSDYGFTTFTCACGYEYIGSYRFYSDILDDAYADNARVLAEGVDISKYQHKVDPSGSYLPIDFAAMKAEGIDFVILKIGSTLRNTNGMTLGGLEPTFEADYAAAKAAGLNVGVYFYTYATTVSQIKADAEWMLIHLSGKQFEYPIYLDLEDDSQKDLGGPLLTEMCMEFFTILQRNGYYTGLYINNNWLQNILQTEKMLDNFEIWYARYPDTNQTPVWDTEKYGAHLGMWQYSDKGSLSSLPAIPIDLNYAYKDYPALIKQHGFNGFSQ